MVDKLPFLPDEHHYAIAAVAARSAQLDHSIEHSISFFLSNKNTAHFLLHNLQGPKLISLLKALLDDYLPEHQQRIDDVIGRISKSRGDRNNLLHWLWGKSDHPDKIEVVEIRPYRPRRSKTMTAAEIQAIAEEALRLCWDLHQLEKLLMDKIHVRLREPLLGTPGLLSPLFGSASPPGPGLLDTPEEPGPQREPSPE